MKNLPCKIGHVFNVAILLLRLNAYFCSGFTNSNSNAFFELEPPRLIQPGPSGQTLYFLNETGLIIPCRAHGSPSPKTTWILANKLFDATEIYTDIHNGYNNLNLNNDIRSLSSISYSKNRFRRSTNKSDFQYSFSSDSSFDHSQKIWLHENMKLKELPGLRYIRADGSLVFPPFSSSLYTPLIHNTGYVCIAWNEAGAIISSQTNVKAVVNSQEFSVEINDESTIIGGSVIFKCSVPSSELTYSKVEQWSINDSNINRQTIIDETSKFIMLTNGELLVKNINVNDVQLRFNCQVKRLLNGELVSNKQPAKILLYAQANSNLINSSILSDVQPSILSSHMSNNGQIIGSPLAPRITFMSPSIILEKISNNIKNEFQSEIEYMLHGTPIIGNSYSLSQKMSLKLRNDKIYSNSPSTNNILNINNNDYKVKRLVLGCVSSLSKASYYWFRNGELIRSNDFFQLYGEILIINLNNNLMSLLKTKVEAHGLIGIFSCQVTNNTDFKDDFKFNLSRQLEIKIIRKLQTKFLSNALVIKAGQRAELNCTINGLFTNVDWFKDGRPLLLNSNSHLYSSSTNHMTTSTIETNNQQSYHSYLNSDSLVNNFSKSNDRKNLENKENQLFFSTSAILKLRSVRRENSGVYQCIARDGSQSSEASIRLNIEDEPPRFLEVFTERQLTVGSSISLKCMASGNPLPQITWTLDDQPLDSVSGASNIMMDKILENTNNLVDSSIVSQNDRILSASSAALSLSSSSSANSLLVDASSSNSLLNNGASLANELNNMRVGDYVTSENLVVSFVNISSLEPSHGGMYRCSAYSELAVVSHQAEISLSDAKLFVRSMRNQRLIAGKDLRIRCPVTYSPDNILEWYKGSNRLPANHRQVVFPNGTLNINSVDKSSDEGEYRCVVRNKVEQVQTSFQLIIQVAPKIEPFQLPSNIQINQRLSITCTVIRGDAPLILSWYKDGRLMDERLASELEFKLHQLEEYSSTLLFHRVRPEHRGNYTCKAKNEVAEDAYSQLMTIFEPPLWTHEPNDQTAIKGKKVWITCQAHGFPKPVVSWKIFDNSSAKYRTIVSSFHLQILDNGTLYIENVQKSDSGNFLCQASNGVDMDLSKVVRLSVYEAAHFRIKFRSHTIQIGQPVSIACEAFGELPITLTWLKENTLISADNVSGRKNSIDLRHGNGSLQSTLTISAVERRDSAFYSCAARNQFGSDHSSIQLIVQEPPDCPNEIKLSEIKSRSATITWQLPFNGNARIEQMRLSLKEFNNKLYSFDNVRNITFSPLQTGQWIIGELQPYTNYSFTLAAINPLGESLPSESLFFQTEEEVPNESPKHIKTFPLSTKSIKITWNPPESRYKFGKIRGYYIGYKELHSSGPYIYKTITIDNSGLLTPINDLRHDQTNSNLWQPSQTFKAETTLKNLIRNTKYEIIIQPFNTKGGGTLSEKIYAQTFLEDAPKTPIIVSTKVNHNSVTLNWKYDSLNSQATGFKLQCTSPGNQIIEKTLHGSDIDSFTFNKLQCGTKYEFSIAAFNSVGFSEKTQSVFIKTNGSSPVAPSKDLLIQFLNSTTVELNLASWKPDICPIQRFSIKYRRRNEQIYTILSTNSQWSTFNSKNLVNNNGILIDSNSITSSSHLPAIVNTAVGNHFENEDISELNNYKASDSTSLETDGRLLIDGLHSQNWYELKISAHSEGGTTEADYSFFTHSSDKSKPSISLAYDSSLYNVLFEFEVIVPLCLSIIVVLAVVTLLYMLLTKRNFNRNSFDHSSNFVDQNGCIVQNKTTPYPTLQASKIHDGLSLVPMNQSPNKIMECNLPEECCTATTGTTVTNSSNNSPALSSISSQQHYHLQQPHCQFYTDSLINAQQTINQANYYPCPYASVKINDNSTLAQSCATLLPANKNIYYKQLCDFTNTGLQCNTLATAQQLTQTALSQNLSNLNSLPNLSNLATTRKCIAEECQYATVKRTARKSDRNNIYDYPVKSSHVTITENFFEEN